MSKIKAWILALRPRTLFLAIATALCGSGIAYYNGKFSSIVFVLTLLIAIVLQLLSNLANDLGDFQKGTDTTGERIGPKRMVQSGAITPQQMKVGIAIVVALAAIIGLYLVYIALQAMKLQYILIFVFLGLTCIIAAIKYTVGKKPYGYRGLGDLFSFIFFGPVPVVGTYFLHTHNFDFTPWLPAIALGLLSVSVLNINNMRDIDNDKKSGKNTIPVRIGINNAKYYHAALLIGAMLCFLLYNILYTSHYYQYIYILTFILFVKILMDIFKIQDNKLLDPYLKYTSMSTFILSISFVICINL